MLSIWDFASVLRAAQMSHAPLVPLVQGAFYMQAPPNVDGEFIVNTLQSCVFIETLAGPQGMVTTWQLCGIADDRDGHAAMWWLDGIVNELYLLFSRGEETLTPFFEPHGYECELSRVLSMVPPSKQQIGNASKWRFGVLAEIIVQPKEEF